MAQDRASDSDGKALRALNLTVRGSAYALIGANGAGKTTVIRKLMNIIEPSREAASQSDSTR